MTLQAFLPIERDPLVGCRRSVRIVACGARQSIAGLLLAFAVQERLPLAGRTTAGSVFAVVHEVQCVVEQVIAGGEIRHLLAVANDGRLAFEVTVEANRIAPYRL